MMPKVDSEAKLRIKTSLVAAYIWLLSILPDDLAERFSIFNAILMPCSFGQIPTPQYQCIRDWVKHAGICGATGRYYHRDLLLSCHPKRFLSFIPDQQTHPRYLLFQGRGSG